MMNTTAQVLASLALVAAVLYGMWRIPPERGENFLPWAPLLALVSAWAGMLAMLGTCLLWFITVADVMVAAVFLLLDPLALATGILTLWLYRRFTPQDEAQEASIAMQRLQARMGLALGLTAVALGYWFVMSHKTPFTPVGQ